VLIQIARKTSVLPVKPVGSKKWSIGCHYVDPKRPISGVACSLAKRAIEPALHTIAVRRTNHASFQWLQAEFPCEFVSLIFC